MEMKKPGTILNIGSSIILAFFAYLSISSLSSSNAFSYGILTSIFRQSMFLFYLTLAIISIIFLFKDFYWAKITSIVAIAWYGVMFFSEAMIRVIGNQPAAKPLYFYVFLAIVGIILVSVSIKNQN